MFSPDDLPWDNVEAKYRLRLPDNHTEDFPGASFVNGVTTKPVTAITAKRLYQSFGKLIIEPWESSGETPKVKQIKPPVLSPSEAAKEIAKIAKNAGLPDDLDAMNRYELMDIAKELGLDPHWRTGERRLKIMIRNARSND